MTNSLLDVLHRDARGLFDAGLLDEVILREFDAVCLPPVKTYTPGQIKKRRLCCKARQAVFAAFPNTSKSTVQ